MDLAVRGQVTTPYEPETPIDDISAVSRGLIKAYGPPAGAEGPIRMVRDFWSVEPGPKQAEMLRAYGAGERGITVRSGHGVGKTAGLSWCAINSGLCRYPQKTVITAPSAGQLFDALYSEMVSWIEKLPPEVRQLLNVTATRIELRASPKDSFISFRTARAENPEALQGVHSEHVLLIADEASGVPEQIFEAAIGSMSGHNATTMLASNPTKTTGFFYDTHTKAEQAAHWKRIHISCEDSPLVSDDFEAEVARAYGRDSNAYRIRYLGEFPEGDMDTVIPRALVDAAFERDVNASLTDEEIWGLDVARFGNDSSVLLMKKGVEVTDIVQYDGLDTMQLVGRVHAEYKDRRPDRRPRLIIVDVIGVGGGVVDRLRELGLPVRGVNTSENQPTGAKHLNLRAELWFKARKWFTDRVGKLPDTKMGRKMGDQLCTPTYDYTSSGKLVVESKKAMRKRGVASPNHADAFVLTLAAPAARMIHGRSANMGGGPLKRNLTRIV